LSDFEAYRLLIAAFLGVLGLFIGSFLNVCIYRLPKEESIVNPPSHCPKCGTRLKPKDLVPVFSWLFLKGKCRYCGAPISPQYALVELATGALFAAVFWHSGHSWLDVPTILDIIFCTAMLGAFVADLNTFILPDEFTAVALVAALGRAFFVWFTTPQSVRPEYAGHLGSLTLSLPVLALLGMVVGVITFYLVGVLGKLAFKKDALGMGDVKLAAALGARFGLTAQFWSLCLLAVFAGAVISIGLMVLKKVERDSLVPFGPFLAGSAVVMVFWGERIARFVASIYGLN